MRLITLLLVSALVGCVEASPPKTFTGTAPDPWQTIYCGSEKSPRDSVTIYRRTARMKVPTGWLYRTTAESDYNSDIKETTTFVLDPFHEPEKRDRK